MPAEPAGYRFGPFVLDTVAFRLYRAGAPVPVSPKIVDLLHYLAARPSTLVTKEELFAALWPDVAVTDNALTQAVSELRQALGDDPASPTYIQTVARRGYRFVAPVDALAPVRPDAASGVGAGGTRAVRVIAVTDFVNLAGDTDFAWLATGIAETVTNDLRELGGHNMVRLKADTTQIVGTPASTAGAWTRASRRTRATRRTRPS